MTGFGGIFVTFSASSSFVYTFLALALEVEGLGSLPFFTTLDLTFKFCMSSSNNALNPLKDSLSSRDKTVFVHYYARITTKRGNNIWAFTGCDVGCVFYFNF